MRNLDLHFLNVGHGDCTIIDFENHLTVVDINACKKFATPTRDELRRRYSKQINSSAPSLASSVADFRIARDEEGLIDPVEYIKANFGGRSIFRYIQSHPDMDHMAGLHRLVNEERISIINLWDTDHSIQKEEKATKWSNVNFDKRDWQTYQRLRSGMDGCKVLKLQRNAQGNFWSDDGINVWAPFENTENDNEDADPNYFSYVISITIGKCVVVLGGDLPTAQWDDLLERNGGELPKVNLLKASHHGRKSGYSIEAVKAMKPDVTVCSVGELRGKDDASASYERFSVKGCFSTVDHGTIIATCWEDGEVWLKEEATGKTIVRTFQ